jgi:UDP-glucose 4-epimerase
MKLNARKTWLLLGGQGFIGTHLTKFLLSKGQKVVSYDIASEYTTEYNRTYALENTSSNCDVTYLYGPIPNASDITGLIYNCDYIINLASVVGVAGVIKDPRETIQSNLKLSLLVDTVNQQAMKPLFYASSSEVYGDIPKGVDRLTEDMETRLGPTKNPRTSYAAVKRLVESIVIHAPYPAVVGRFFNVTGACQDPSKGVIPAMIHSALTENYIDVIYSGHQTRSFTHVSIICNYIYELMTNSSTYNEVYNLGSGDAEISMNTLAKIIIHHLETEMGCSNIDTIQFKSSEIDPFHRRVPCVDKVIKAIGMEYESIPIEIIVREVTAYIIDKYISKV